MKHGCLLQNARKDPPECLINHWMTIRNTGDTYIRFKGTPMAGPCPSISENISRGVR